MLNIGEAFGGVFRHPYVGAQTEGPKGFGKGIGRGLFGLYSHLFAGTQFLPSKHSFCTDHGLMRSNTALHAIPGYSLKGVEQAMSKLRLKPLHAEILLIRLRQANYEYTLATEAERAEVIENWKKLQRCTGQAAE